LIGFDAQEFERAIDNETNEFVILKVPNNDVRIDRVVYTVLCDALRQANYLTKNVAYAMNEATRLWMIQDDKDEREKAKREGYKSRLAPLISSMVNSSGFKYNYDTVQDLNLYLFMDAVRRILKIDGYKNLMTGIYSGTIDAKKIRNKKEFNWMGEIK